MANPYASYFWPVVKYRLFLDFIPPDFGRSPPNESVNGPRASCQSVSRPGRVVWRFVIRRQVVGNELSMPGASYGGASCPYPKKCSECNEFVHIKYNNKHDIIKLSESAPVILERAAFHYDPAIDYCSYKLHVKTLQLTTNMRVFLQQVETANVFARQLLDIENNKIAVDTSTGFITFFRENSDKRYSLQDVLTMIEDDDSIIKADIFISPPADRINSDEDDVLDEIHDQGSFDNY
ncbi:hypothetical protein HELRODRAFT_165048 [Helobdella robusta]|uniref:Uncharacterized protein n=1 Tax=Helobdella robusta TaxID=6412 RepID=T1EW71_HELRO|nr:hypothetical protein HELRODRAFT_165048 [Helobdella robusta]ESN92911.1 hypothetical protein HELRODRAFT_165048 [Helobdella robusta]